MAYTMNKMYQKSILTAYTDTDQTVAANGDVVYNNVVINDGISIEYVAGEPTITLPYAGAYLVSVNADASATSDSTTGGLITLQLENNGTAVPGVVASEDVTTDTAIVNLGFTTVIKVKPSCPMVCNKAVLSVVNTGIAATYTNATITIVKLC